MENSVFSALLITLVIPCFAVIPSKYLPLHLPDDSLEACYKIAYYTLLAEKLPCRNVLSGQRAGAIIQKVVTAAVKQEGLSNGAAVGKRFGDAFRQLDAITMPLYFDLNGNIIAKMAADQNVIDAKNCMLLGMDTAGEVLRLMKGKPRHSPAAFFYAVTVGTFAEARKIGLELNEDLAMEFAENFFNAFQEVGK